MSETNDVEICNWFIRGEYNEANPMTTSAHWDVAQAVRPTRFYIENTPRFPRWRLNVRSILWILKRWVSLLRERAWRFST